MSSKSQVKRHHIHADNAAIERYESETGRKWLNTRLWFLPLPCPMTESQSALWGLFLAVVGLAIMLGFAAVLGAWSILVACSAFVTAHLMLRSIASSKSHQEKLAQQLRWVGSVGNDF